MIILGIETSCDETAAAVVQNGRRVLSSSVATQFEHHGKYAGVVPELASRAHVSAVNRAVSSAIAKARRRMKRKSTKGSPGLDLRGIDAIGVTTGPGLAGSLLIGKMTAETLGWVTNKPVLPVNHIEGHLLSPFLAHHALKPPFLGLVASGGHTELIYSPSWGKYELVGATRDDAAGEAFDKVAKMMRLGYPGGPVVDQMARKGSESRFPFPRPWLPGSWDFSFSGLKTAVLYKLRTKRHWSQKEKYHLCAGFQHAVVDVLVGKTLAAGRVLGVDQIIVGGGVAANSFLREKFLTDAKRSKRKVYLVPPALCTDNAAMIGAAVYVQLKKNIKLGRASLAIQPQWRISPAKRHLPSFKLSLTNY